MRPKVFTLVGTLAILTSPSLGVAVAQEADRLSPRVTIEKVAITPTDPAADTLCKLRVTVANHGSEVASQLDFKVKINGQELPVYRNQLFMYPVPAGQTSEIPLYNFWSTETSRPMPADGKLAVEVTLAAARWMKITMEEEVEVWQPLGDVEGLPHSQAVSLTMRR
jgi:hypothetical protein